MENQVIVPLQGSQIECFVPFVNTTIIWGLYDIQFLNIKKKKGKKNQIKYIKVRDDQLIKYIYIIYHINYFHIKFFILFFFNIFIILLGYNFK